MKAHASNPILKRLKQESPHMFEGTLAYIASFRAVRINCKILSQREKKNRRREQEWNVGRDRDNAGI